MLQLNSTKVITQSPAPTVDAPVDLVFGSNPTITLSANQLRYSMAAAVASAGATFSGDLENFKVTCSAAGTWRRVAFKITSDFARFSNRQLTVSVSGYEANYDMAAKIPRMWLQYVTSTGAQTGPSIPVAYPATVQNGYINMPSDAVALWLFVGLDNGFQMTTGQYCIFKGIQIVYGDERIEPQSVQIMGDFTKNDSNHETAFNLYDQGYAVRVACPKYVFTGDEVIVKQGTGTIGGEPSSIWRISLPWAVVSQSSTNVTWSNRWPVVTSTGALSTSECLMPGNAVAQCSLSLKDSRLKTVDVAGVQQWFRDNYSYALFVVNQSYYNYLSPEDDAKVRSMKTSLGYTVVTNDQSANMTTTLYYVADTKLYIDNAIKKALGG